MKRLIAFFLASLMVLSLISCASHDPAKNPSDSTPEAGTTSPAETDPPETVDTFYDDRTYAKDSLPETMDFNGTSIRFLVSTNPTNSDWGNEFFSEDNKDSTDTLDDALYRRNSRVEDRLKISLDWIMINPNEVSIEDKLRTSVMSFSDDYDITTAGIGCGEEGMFRDLLALSYPDFDQPWWNHSYNENIAVDGRMFSCAGEIGVSMISFNYVTFFNKKVWNDFYSDTDLYQIIRDGNWTLDKMTEFCSGVYRDLNANGLADNEDLYGNVHPYGAHQSVVWGAAAKLQYTQYDEESGYYLYVLDNDRTQTFLEKMKVLMFRDNNSYVSENNEMDTDESMTRKLKEDTALFTLLRMSCCAFLRDMESDFGIVTLPKLNEAQEEYHTTADDITVFSVVNTTPVEDIAGACLEALCSESYRIVTPAYYDTAVKFKYARDEESAEMLDICTRSILYDFATVHWGWWGVILQTQMISEKNFDRLFSYIEKNRKSWEGSLAEILDNFRAVD